MDSGKKENEKAVSYFKLKKSQLPALTIYRTVDDKWDALPVSEVSVERVQNFYEGFLEGKLLVSMRLNELLSLLFVAQQRFLRCFIKSR